ncbi:hypothetical protein SLE2022_246310 [Rubroshorea leprosula]
MAAALVSSILVLVGEVSLQVTMGTARLGEDSLNELERLRNNLAILNWIFHNTRVKRTDRAIEFWLDGLTDAAYDLVDVLNEWNAAHGRFRIKGVGKTSILKAKVGSFVTHCLRTTQVVRRDDLAFKLKKFSDRLDEIATDLNKYHLISISTSSRWIESTFVDVSEILGRDEVKGDIVSSLLSASTEQLKTISVVGMGGMGKTAIAQLVYQDEVVKQHFDHRIWVCVSGAFDECEVAKTIIKEVEHVKRFEGANSLNSFPLSALLDRVCRTIHGKKFFLVLDDVWADNVRHWEGLIQTFKHGAPGSRILLTTRNGEVANIMESTHVFHFEPLSDEHCWMVFSQTAFYGRGVEECPNLEDIGKRISKKCKGVPFSAMTLGGLLRFKSSREEWENILNSKIWGLDTMQEDLFVSLLLCYYDLPLPLQECFKYCAIFPKDFVYDEETITYHWMAQGYLGLTNNEDLELEGREYISYLAACSFFHDFQLDPDGLKSTWKMHDILHDFAQFLMINDGIVIQVNPGGNSVIDLSSRNARYLTACIPEGHCLPTSIYGAEKLRSLMIISGENAITNEAVRIIFNQAKQLRLVDFGCHNASMDTIPKEIGNLIRLRHINFSGSKIKRLPRSLCELYNLQYLNLDNSECLENLPDEIGNLINLRHIICSGSKIKGLPRSLCKLHNLRYLNLDNCKALENLPDEIGDLINLIHLGTLHCYRLACYPKSARYLRNLRRLRGIVLRADRNDPKEFALGDLEYLNKLCELSMVLKGNAVDDRELKRAKFEKKIYLEEIKVE